MSYIQKRSLEKRPPRLARWLLHRMAEYQEQYLMVGDLDEIFCSFLCRRSRIYSVIWYWRQVLSCLPGYVHNALVWRLAMFISYFKSAIRNLIKNRQFSMISLLGLALAIGCFTVTFSYMDTMRHIDDFHTNGDRIFYAEIMIERSGHSQLWGPTPVPLGPAMKQDFVQVVHATRIMNRMGTVSCNGQTFAEQLVFTEPDFLEMFTFSLLSGSSSVLNSRNAIVISDRIARKYFGDENAVGRLMTLSNANGFQDEFLVEAVVQRPPAGSSIKFDILIPYARIVDWGNVDLQNWSAWTQTFIQVNDASDIALLSQQMQPYVRLQNESNKEWAIQRFLFEPLGSLVTQTYNVQNSINSGPPPSSQVAMFVFGVALLLLACLNYVNIGIVTSTRRLREIGVRKVLGSSRNRLIAQFISENVLLCLLSIMMGAALAGSFLMPSFNRMFGSPLKLDLLHNTRLWTFYLGTLFVTAFLSGGYPALYVSRFQPVSILRKNERVGGGSRLTKVFLVFQLMIAFLMLAIGVVFIQNSQYQEKLDWGYEADGLIHFRFENSQSVTQFKNALAQQAHVVSVAGSRHHVGCSFNIDVVSCEGKTYEINSFQIGHDYLQTLGVHLKAGRLFEQQHATDQDAAIVINSLFARRMGWENPLGETVEIGNKTYGVAGVVEDFFYQIFALEVQPLLFRLAPPDKQRYLTVRVREGKEEAVLAESERLWKQQFPNVIFGGMAQKRIWDQYLSENRSVYQMSMFVGLVALGIACMGLYGMISIGILKRLKEVSIRKVMGASPLQIIHLLNHDLLFMLGFALILGLPLSFVFIRAFFNSAFQGAHTALTPAPFLVAGVVLLLTALLTASTQLIRAARSNVVSNLKME